MTLQLLVTQPALVSTEGCATCAPCHLLHERTVTGHAIATGVSQYISHETFRNMHLKTVVYANMLLANLSDVCLIMMSLSMTYKF